MKTSSGHASQHEIHVPHDLRSNGELAMLDVDAKRAFLSFCEQITLVCLSAPEDIGARGFGAARLYLAALQADTADPGESTWRNFIRAVWKLLNELDRYPPHASRRRREARGSLIRIVVDNADLLEPRSDPWSL